MTFSGRREGDAAGGVAARRGEEGEVGEKSSSSASSRVRRGVPFPRAMWEPVKRIQPLKAQVCEERGNGSSPTLLLALVHNALAQLRGACQAWCAFFA